MADEYRTSKSYSVARVAPILRDEEQGRRAFHHAPPHFEPPPEPTSHDDVDVASILGLPVEALTTEVMDVLSGLIGEMERLRWQEEQHRHREAYLEQLSDRHTIVPALNRRAFMRELNGVLTGQDVPGTLAIMHVGGMERLRHLYGLAAGEGGLRHVCAHLLGALRKSDLAGLLGGSDFAVLLPGTEATVAHEKVAEIAGRINEHPFTWLGQPVIFDIHSGFHELKPGEDAETALAAADRARRGLEEGW